MTASSGPGSGLAAPTSTGSAMPSHLLGSPSGSEHMIERSASVRQATRTLRRLSTIRLRQPRGVSACLPRLCPEWVRFPSPPVLISLVAIACCLPPLPGKGLTAAQEEVALGGVLRAGDRRIVRDGRLSIAV